MKVAYFDCFSGISGDMCLGAILANGLPHSELEGPLKELPLDGWELKISETKQHGIAAVDVEVLVSGHQPHRHLNDILDLIEGSDLPAPVREKAAAVFRSLARAEGQVHGIEPEKVHFHEVGAVDAIIDIVGTVLGLHLLGIEKIVSSPLPLGSGWIECHHGRLPVPAPATLYLLRGFPVYGTDIRAELVTPTGAALITTLAADFGPFPAMELHSVGFGAGKTVLPHPNLLRLATGEIPAHDVAADEACTVIETTIDDMNPEFYPNLQEQVLAAGAVDAYITPVQMKKGRPGVLFTAICPEHQLQSVAAAIFRHSSTLGLRFRRDWRITCERQFTEVMTPYGKVTVKWGRYRDGDGRENIHAAPEYESCRRVAQEAGVPVKEVYAAAVAAARAIVPF
ncbi:Pyridinium-3,5-bisthiocarboxylic acid mononucleotide nickel insertion protein [Moorella humiferrea]|uniref:nickel pincer cofactor biosynthesis protein LarC n=1 Tax=Neomoorella humiferrea TaxID=676965 RepID=UPI0030CCDB26